MHRQALQGVADHGEDSLAFGRPDQLVELGGDVGERLEEGLPARDVQAVPDSTKGQADVLNDRPEVLELVSAATDPALDLLCALCGVYKVSETVCGLLRAARPGLEDARANPHQRERDPRQ